MLQILILHQFLSLSLQQSENINTDILPRENQFLEGVITNLNEKISKNKIIGFGLWFKWQPETLIAISIYLAYYEDFIAIKASLIFLVIFAYSFISNSVSPYMTGELNRFDTQSTTVCAVSIILGSSIYSIESKFYRNSLPFFQNCFDKWLVFSKNDFLFFSSQKFPKYVQKHPFSQKVTF